MSGRSRFLMVLSIALMLCIAALPMNVSADAVEISGTISLPDNETAPAGGMEIEIGAEGDGGSDWAEVFIPEGAHSADFSMYVEPGEYQIYYYIYDGLNNTDYVQEGLYSESGMVSGWDNAPFIQVGTSGLSNLDMTVLTGQAVSGTLSLPNDTVAPPGGVNVSVRVDGDGYANRSYLIPEGYNSINYLLYLAPGSYNVGYRTNTAGYAQNGYYSSTETVASYEYADSITVGASGISGIDMTLLTGYAIRGTVSLPAGEVAPLGGGRVYIYAEGDGYAYKYITIPQGSSSYDYELYVPAGSYTVRYRALSWANGFITEGYYNESGTVTDYYNATPIAMGAADVDDIDLAILRSQQVGQYAIRGRVSLPNGELAPEGGLEVELYAFDVNNYYDEYQYVEIPSGANYADYQIFVEPGSYRLRFNVYDSRFLQTGYYNSGGSVQEPFEADSIVVDAADAANVNMDFILRVDDHGNKLETATLVQSTGIEIPGEFESAGDADYFKFVPAVSGIYEFHTNSLIDTFGYLYDSNGDELTHDDDNGLGWNFSMSYDLTGGNTYYIKARHYDTDGTGSYSLVVTELVGIKGRVYLPAGETAPENGFTVEVHANGTNNSYWRYVTIPQGANYADYAMATATQDTYRVNYQVYASGYVNYGYYNSAGTVTDYNASTPVSVDTQTVENIDLQIMKAPMVRGSISLPAGEQAPAGGLQFYVYSSSSTYGFSQLITIPEGSSNAAFDINVVPGNYRVSYQALSEGSSYIREGYYTSTGTVAEYANASLLAVDEAGLNGINLTVLKGRAIRGTISLPNGEYAPEGGVNVTIQASGSMYVDDVTTTILQGQNDAEYTLYVPSGNYKLIYYINNGSYIGQGYYNSTGTVAGYNDADIVSVGDVDLNAMDLSILKERTISGTVSLPSGVVAPAGGFYVNISAISSDYGYNSYVTIPENANSIGYELQQVAPGNYRIAYNTSASGYVSNGYYNTTGTTADYGNASVIQVRSADLGNMGITIIGNGYADDHGNTRETATLVEALGTGIAGVIDFVGDEDYFRFVPAQSGTYTIQTGSVIDTYGYLLDSNGVQITYDDDAGTDNNFFITSNLTAGNTYYIKVRHYSAHGLGSYSLVIDRTVTGVISGTITLPDNEEAPVGGYSFFVKAQSSSYSYNQYVTIPEGQSSIGYELYVEPGNYRVYYEASFSGYTRFGYHSSTGMVIGYDEAGIVNVDSTGVSGIDLTMIKTQRINGEISLPVGESAPVGGMYVEVSAGNQYGSYADLDVFIAEGTSQAGYSIEVAPGSYKVNYHTDDNRYVEFGYFNSTGMVPSINHASSVTVGTSDVGSINLTLIKALKIRGRISLPTGESAPAGGLTIYVNAESEDSGYAFGEAYIEGGANWAEYVLNVASGSYRIHYYQNQSSSYVQNGYYSNSGTVQNYHEASLVTIGTQDISNIDLTMIKTQEIRGRISLPTGNAPAGGMDVYIYAQNEDGGDVYGNVHIDEGASGADYILNVVPGSYIVHYSANYNGYIQNGYYSSTGTVAAYHDASLVAVGAAAVDNINMVLIKAQEIRGRISLPAGEFAPAGGIDVAIDVQSEDGSYANDYVHIEGGASWVDYTLNVSPGSYRVHYYSYYNVYVRNGYYNSTQTVVGYDNASIVSVGTTAVDNINMTLIKAQQIRGTISLPAGVTAPEGGLEIGIEAESDEESFMTEAYINENESTAEYVLNVAPGSYTLGYYIYADDTDGYAQQGFYSSTGTVAAYDLAAPVTVAAEGVSNINMTLLTGYAIRGTITLPDGETAPENGLEVRIRASGDGFASQYVTIPEHESSTDYVLYVVPGDYRVSYSKIYDVPSSHKSYIWPGYYSASGTVSYVNSNEASNVTVDSAGVQDIDMTILKGLALRGSISLPEGVSAPNGGIEIEIRAYHSSNSFRYGELYIPMGATSSDYELYVAPGNYKISYRILYMHNEDEYYDSGFRNGNEMVLDYSSASPITVDTADVNNLDMMLLRMAASVGDVNTDGRVDIDDLAIITRAYGSVENGPGWDERADLNGDGQINHVDMAILKQHYR